VTHGLELHTQAPSPASQPYHHLCPTWQAFGKEAGSSPELAGSLATGETQVSYAHQHPKVASKGFAITLTGNVLVIPTLEPGIQVVLWGSLRFELESTRYASRSAPSHGLVVYSPSKIQTSAVLLQGTLFIFCGAMGLRYDTKALSGPQVWVRVRVPDPPSSNMESHQPMYLKPYELRT
jgi:hypothetical protein